MAAVTAAIIGAAIIGAGASVYAADQQEEAADKEAQRVKREADIAKGEADRIAEQTKPDGEALASISFGADSTNLMSSTSDFLVPKTGGSLGGTKSGSGLGFSV